MTTGLHQLTTAQQHAIESNFEKVGPFYLSLDLHAMLDCACTWDMEVSADASLRSAVPEVKPLGIAMPGILREEFFGGLFFNTATHTQYLVDRLGYDVLRLAVETPRALEQFASSLGSEGDDAAVRSTTEALFSAGVLQPAPDQVDVTHHAARDLSVSYLQSPAIVEAELTYGCFRACRHCAYSSSPQARTEDELTVEQWATVFDKLARAGVLVIQLTGGDPLFRPDAFEILEAADAAGLSVYVRSDTAALSDESIQRLVALKHLWHVGTSIDGPDAETHDWMRGRGAFDVLRQRIEALAEHGVPVAAGATLHKGNFRQVQDIGRVAASFGARWFDIGFLSPVGRGVQLADLVLEAGEIEEALTLYVEGISAGDYFPSHTHYRRRALRSEPFRDLGGLVGRLPYVTEWPWSRLRIDPTGSTYTAGKLKGSDYAGGFNILTSSVEHLWDNSPNLRQLREFGGGRIHSLDCRLLQSDHEFL